MHAAELIAAALGPTDLPELPQEGVCCLTGVLCQTLPRKLVLGPSFTNLDLLRAPDSPRIGIPAWRALTEPKERQSLWWCDGVEFRLLKRPDARALIIGGIKTERPWCGYVTTSYKKHGALLAPVNTGGRQRWLFEQVVADCSDREQVAEYWGRLNAMLARGATRPLLEGLDVLPAHMAKIGWREWREFERWAMPRKTSPLYQLVCYLLPSQEERKEAGRE